MAGGTFGEQFVSDLVIAVLSVLAPLSHAVWPGICFGFALLSYFILRILPQKQTFPVL